MQLYIIFFALGAIILGQAIKNWRLTKRIKDLHTRVDESKRGDSNILNSLLALEQSNGALVSSIDYARAIQFSMLPADAIVKDVFPEHFIINLPKAIVSGDFYWCKRYNDVAYFAVGDCSGHGVPGAFLTMLGSAMLKLTIQSTNSRSPKQILQYLDNEIVELVENGVEGLAYGIEMSLFIYDIPNQILSISCTNRPILFVSDNEVRILKGASTAIGSRFGAKIFVEFPIPVKKGDRIVMFTDGVTDQFDSVDNLKFGLSRFRKLVERNKLLDFSDQKASMEAELLKWRGGNNQTDDILIVGIQF